MDPTFNIAERITTPLALAALVVMAIFVILHTLVKRNKAEALANLFGRGALMLIIKGVIAVALVAVVLAVLTAGPSSTPGEVRVRVSDSATGAILSKADVLVVAPSGDRASGQTKSDGFFIDRLPAPADRINLRVEAAGYDLYEADDVSTAGKSYVDVRLKPASSKPAPAPTLTPSPDSARGPISLKYAYNPRVEQVVADLERVRHVSIRYVQCGVPVRKAVVRLNGAQLDGDDEKGLLENAGGRANVQFSVRKITEGIYEIACY